MKAILTAAAALAAAAPAAAEPTPDQAEAIAAVDAFFAALRSDDKTALARQMLPEGMIFIHNRMTPDAPRVEIVPVAKHLENWAKSPPGLDERMIYDTVLVDGDMAQVWGPYRFIAGGKTSHCGINSMSLVKRDGMWKVANTSFTIESPDRCEALGSPEAAQ
ncbi:nuclear transport factor 2 family protein [Erythrobacter sp. NFXS35]|uniref:nuclear transport factor 2 family protein n=1 Tax=Erythrobacter sp. NFXS35 TaxID=2818436 RepID=UPI0032DF38A4